jgi:threonylcarbamoyladenosine tRNA methylthiotransferase MtaB
LGGDFIVGYPGEGQEDVDETMQQIQELGFTYGHVFRYSKRPGTPAALMDNQIAEAVKTSRSEQLRRVLDSCSERFVLQALGSTGRIIVEQGATVRGVTSNYLRVEVEDLTIVQRNRWLDVQCIRVDERQPRSCIARVLPP